MELCTFFSGIGSATYNMYNVSLTLGLWVLLSDKYIFNNKLQCDCFYVIV